MRPYGTRNIHDRYPALKRRATIRRPYGAIDLQPCMDPPTRRKGPERNVVPEGPLIIARQFSGGSTSATDHVPGGTVETSPRPLGTDAIIPHTRFSLRLVSSSCTPIATKSARLA